MVMDQIFGGPLSFLRLEQEPGLEYIDNSKDLLPEMSMDLEDFQFDLDTISDSLGPWIQPAETTVADLLRGTDSCKSEPIDFEDLDITEAVRYDCMWSTSTAAAAALLAPAKSSNSSSNSVAIPLATNSRNSSTGNNNNNNISSNPLSHPFCENALLDEFLRLLDTPSAAGHHAHTDLANMDIKTEVKEEEEEELRSRAVRFTSLDHCYVSTACPPIIKHEEDASNFIDTPPESSDDDDEDMPSPLALRHSSSYSRHLHHHHHHHRQSQINSSSNINNNSVGTSLLKKSTCSSSGVAKFSFRVKLKTESSRSVLKHHLRTVRSPLKVSAIGFKSSHGSSSSTNSSSSGMQAGVRRRKEASLKLKHEEAREVHNQMERQRRNELKVAFDELKASIVDIAASDKVSKQMILDKAVERCEGLRSREASLRQRRERLKRSNSLLKARLRALQQQPPPGC